MTLALALRARGTAARRAAPAQRAGVRALGCTAAALALVGGAHLRALVARGRGRVPLGAPRAARGRAQRLVDSRRWPGAARRPARPGARAVRAVALDAALRSPGPPAALLPVPGPAGARARRRARSRRPRGAAARSAWLRSPSLAVGLRDGAARRRSTARSPPPVPGAADLPLSLEGALGGLARDGARRRARRAGARTARARLDGSRCGRLLFGSCGVALGVARGFPPRPTGRRSSVSSSRSSWCFRARGVSAPTRRRFALAALALADLTAAHRDLNATLPARLLPSRRALVGRAPRSRTAAACTSGTTRSCRATSERLLGRSEPTDRGRASAGRRPARAGLRRRSDSSWCRRPRRSSASRRATTSTTAASSRATSTTSATSCATSRARRSTRGCCRWARSRRSWRCTSRASRTCESRRRFPSLMGEPMRVLDRPRRAAARPARRPDAGRRRWRRVARCLGWAASIRAWKRSSRPGLALARNARRHRVASAGSSAAPTVSGWRPRAPAPRCWCSPTPTIRAGERASTARRCPCCAPTSPSAAWPCPRAGTWSSSSIARARSSGASPCRSRRSSARSSLGASWAADPAVGRGRPRLASAARRARRARRARVRASARRGAQSGAVLDQHAVAPAGSADLAVPTRSAAPRSRRPRARSSRVPTRPEPTSSVGGWSLGHELSRSARRSTSSIDAASLERSRGERVAQAIGVDRHGPQRAPAAARRRAASSGWSSGSSERTVVTPAARRRGTSASRSAAGAFRRRGAGARPAPAS